MQATTVLVEGESDRLAVEALAFRCDHNLASERVQIIPMGGATSIVHYLERYGPKGSGHRILGLCDAGESKVIARALLHAGVGSGPLEERWFQVCDTDLEDDLSDAWESTPCSTSSGLKASWPRSGSSNASPHCGTGPWKSNYDGSSEAGVATRFATLPCWSLRCPPARRLPRWLTWLRLLGCERALGSRAWDVGERQVA